MLPRSGQTFVGADGQRYLVPAQQIVQTQGQLMYAQEQALRQSLVSLDEEERAVLGARGTSYVVAAPLETAASLQNVSNVPVLRSEPVRTPNVSSSVPSSVSTSQSVVESRSTETVSAATKVGYQPPPRGSREDRDMAAVPQDWYQMTLDAENEMEHSGAVELSDKAHEVMLEDGFSVPTFSDKDIGNTVMNDATVKATIAAVARGEPQAAVGLDLTGGAVVQQGISDEVEPMEASGVEESMAPPPPPQPANDDSAAAGKKPRRRGNRKKKAQNEKETSGSEAGDGEESGNEYQTVQRRKTRQSSGSSTDTLPSALPMLDDVAADKVRREKKKLLHRRYHLRNVDYGAKFVGIQCQPRRPTSFDASRNDVESDDDDVVCGTSDL